MHFRNSLALILVLTSISVSAQNRKLIFGISSSVDYNSYISVSDMGPLDFRGKINYSGGLIIRYILNDKVSISSKILFSTKNFKEVFDLNEFRSMNPDDPFLIIGDEIRVIYSNLFLDIPIELNYKLNQAKTFDFLFSIGLVNSILVGYNKHVSSELFAPDSKMYNDLLMSLKIGLGFLIRTNSFGINIEPQLRYYLSRVHRNYPNENPTHFGIEFQFLRI